MSEGPCFQGETSFFRQLKEGQIFLRTGKPDFSKPVVDFNPIQGPLLADGELTSQKDGDLKKNNSLNSLEERKNKIKKSLDDIYEFFNSRGFSALEECARADIETKIQEIVDDYIGAA